MGIATLTPQNGNMVNSLKQTRGVLTVVYHSRKLGTLTTNEEFDT